MSSPERSSLTIDVRHRRTERRLAAVALASGVCCAALSTLDSWAAVGAALATTIVIAAALHRAGWLGSARRIVHVVWQDDDRWLLEEANGRALTGELSADTRAGNWGVWLRWRIGARFAATRAILLTPGDAAPDELRRLAVRLHTRPSRT